MTHNRVLRAYGKRLLTMKRRAEFQRLRGGVRWSGAAFLMEGKPRLIVGTSGIARFGFTITKKIGKAHERNRMRRRLSHALRLCDVPPVLLDWDIVIVARPPAMTQPFDALLRECQSGLARLARGQQPQAPEKTGHRTKPVQKTTAPKP